MEEATNHKASRAAYLGAACLFAPLLAPLLTGTVFSIGDLADFHLPIRHVYQSALVDGQSILWTNRMFGGFYLHAEGQVGALHPLHLGLYWLLPLTIAFNLELIVSYVFAFAGMSLLLRRFGFSTPAALTGAVAFSFSGFNLLHLLHMNAVAILAHVPWLILSLDGLLFGCRHRQMRSVVCLSLLTASTLLLGYPQYVWIAALICLTYVVVHVRQTTPACLIIAGASATAGVMLGGVQLLPTIDLLNHSSRQEVAENFALTYSLHPLNLVQLFSPYLLSSRVYGPPKELFIHEFGVYNGAFSTLAVAWVLLRWRRLAFREVAIFALPLVVVGLVLALGRYGPLYEWVASLPLIGRFRAPARHIALVHFGLALLTAVAFDDLGRTSNQREDGHATRWIWLPFAMGIALVFVSSAWLATQSTFPGHHVDAVGVVFGATLFFIATIWLIDASRGPGRAIVALPIVLALDLGLWGYGPAAVFGLKTVAEVAASEEAPQAPAGATLHASHALRPNVLLLKSFHIVRPYVGLYPARELTLKSLNELRVAGVEWVQGVEGWQPLPDPLPRLRVVPKAVHTNDPVSAISSIDVFTTAVVDRELPPLDPNATITPVSEEAGVIAVDIVTASHSLLVTTEAYHTGWKALAKDGGELQTLRVYADHLGVLLPPGKYRLTLSFQPASMERGVYVSVAGFVALLGLLVVVSRLSCRTGNG